MHVTGSSVTGSSVTGSNVLLCFTWNLTHCIAILIYNFAIRLYRLVLEFCLYIYGYLQKEVGSLGAGFSLLTLERCIV